MLTHQNTTFIFVSLQQCSYFESC